LRSRPLALDETGSSPAHAACATSL
jgi:hypothetical protein